MIHATKSRSSEADVIDSERRVVSTYERRTYSYLRAAIVCLLAGLAGAVFYQSSKQGEFLSSVSAYYYTPAQAIFVGALIGLGACTIALSGLTTVEDVFLNIAGMFAAVVAVVPTSRGNDFRQAVEACKKQVEDQNCFTVNALEEANRANVQNNMWALIAVAVVGVLASVLIGRRLKRADPAYKEPLWGFWIAGVIALVTVAGFLWWTDWFIAHAHYVAAIGLFVCILIVVLNNATRVDDKKTLPAQLKASNRYAWVAWSMMLVALFGTGLLMLEAITLFLLEIVVALHFAVFWALQTFERLPAAREEAAGRSG